MERIKNLGLAAEAIAYTAFLGGALLVGLAYKKIFKK